MRFFMLVAIYAGVGAVWAILMPLLTDADGDLAIYLAVGMVFFGLTGAALYFWERRSGHIGMLGLMPVVKTFGLLKE